MAEEFLQFLGATENASNFEEFETMWMQMGDELEMASLPQFETSTPPSNASTVSTPKSNASTTTTQSISSTVFTPKSNVSTAFTHPHSIASTSTTTTVTLPVAVSLPSYSPLMDENWPPAASGSTSPPPSLIINEKNSFDNVEDSILTTLRRKNPNRYKMLCKRMVEPSTSKQQSYEGQFRVLRKLLRRISDDTKQIEIVLNYIEDGSGKKRRVKFSSS